MNRIQYKILRICDESKHSIKQLKLRLSQIKNISYTYLVSVLDNLFKSGYLNKIKNGRESYYNTTMSGAIQTIKYEKRKYSSNSPLSLYV